MSRPAESIYFSTVSPPQLAILNDADTTAYLERIGLTAEVLKQAPSFELLSLIHLQHHLSVPYDTSSLHVPEAEWNDNKPQPIVLGRGHGMQLGTRGNFERIIENRRGGFCYANNTLYAALLRSE
jgi:arylamine N-acetyltransferase